jgi:hypothetical protein
MLGILSNSRFAVRYSPFAIRGSRLRLAVDREDEQEIGNLRILETGN